MEYWSYVRVMKGSDTSSSHLENASENTKSRSSLLQKLFLELRGSTSTSRLSQTTILIPNKTFLRTRKLDDLPEKHATYHTAETKEDGSQSDGASAPDASYTVIPNESNTANAKFLNERADTKATLDRRLYKTTNLISLSKTSKATEPIPKERYLPYKKSSNFSELLSTRKFQNKGSRKENTSIQTAKKGRFSVNDDFISRDTPLNTRSIPNKTTLSFANSKDKSTASTVVFENVQALNNRASTAADTYTEVNNDAKADAAKIVKDMSDIQTTKSELLLNTSIQAEISRTVKEKKESTNANHAVNDGQSTDNLRIKQHEIKKSTLRDKITATVNEKYPLSTTNSSKRFGKVVIDETTLRYPKIPGITSQEVLMDNSLEETIPSQSTKNKTSPSVHKRFLVFSPHCRIPDIDPMHPSILQFIEKNPPLDCSKDYKPLTKTQRNTLILDVDSILKETSGRNYTCCYKSVFRINDGLSDDNVGFGEECVKVYNKTTIKEEFITVECKYNNGKLFYKEFHSFILDKPKVEKRCGKHNQSQYSVLIVGADAMSRLNMHRQLNATADYMLRHMSAVEMYGFNKVGDNTFPNLIPLLVGYDERELPSICWKSSNLPLDRCNFLWKRYAKKGYRTFYAEDSPYISSFNYVKEGFLHQPTDYYFRPFILAYEAALGRDKPANCYQCVGSTSETEAVLHWAEQFASHFSTRPYFSFSWINSLTHDFLNMGSSADHMYETFFRTLHQSGALNKTIVIFMGDHGMRWGEIRKTYIGRLEERLPMLLIALPEVFKQQHPRFAEALRENSHRLVTPFDLHATLVHLLNLTKDWQLVNPDKVGNKLSKKFTRRALSLFQPIPDDRSCDDAFIDEHWCTCEPSLEVDTDSDDVKQVSQFLLDKINSLLKSVTDKCAILALDSVSDARLWQPPLEHKGHSASDNIYTVIIHTNPNKAIFEGTVKLSQPKQKAKLLGTISRLNLYGNQSSCIDKAEIRKYCYCL